MFFVNVFWCAASSWNSFHNHDTSNWIYVIIHGEKTFITFPCQIYERYFKKKTEKNWTLANKAPNLFWFPFKDINISEIFLKKYKTQTFERFSHYCDSSVESLRLSALKYKTVLKHHYRSWHLRDSLVSGEVQRFVVKWSAVYCSKSFPAVQSSVDCAVKTLYGRFYGAGTSFKHRGQGEDWMNSNNYTISCVTTVSKLYSYYGYCDL